MKPCSKNRKLIAWLAIGALDAEKVPALREHLALCEGCRRYSEEISNVTAGLRSATPDSDLVASESFHRRTAQKLQRAESNSVLENVPTWFRKSMLTWRVALPAVVAAVILVIMLMKPSRDEAVRLPASPGNVTSVSPSNSGAELAPTIGNYKMLASQSLEEFDEILVRQGNRSLPPVPALTVTSLEPANTAF